MQLPIDDVILLSFVNTKLRDVYSSLSDLCADFGAEEEEVLARLAALGYVYNEEQNAFIRS